MICIIKQYHSLLGSLKLVFDCFCIVFIRCVTSITLIITYCYIFEWRILFVQLQVITLSHVNNCVIINLSFLFLVAIICEGRKGYLCYKEDYMCY